MPAFTSTDLVRPGFSLAMELLCSLPKLPRVALLSSLKHDLHFKTQAQIQEIIDGLKLAGFDIHCRVAGDVGAGVGAYITERGWEHAQIACKNYWETVWGDQSHTAQDLGGSAESVSAAA
jgi:hypothetical protein